jgi:hypothetical protein
LPSTATSLPVPGATSEAAQAFENVDMAGFWHAVHGRSSREGHGDGR